MIFFTDITTDVSSYCVLHIKKYNDRRKKLKKILFIDPGVMELFRSDEYSRLDELHNLVTNGIAKNEFISIDYPPSFNPPRATEFIEKTYLNNMKYKDNPHYICTPQFEHNYFSFIEQANRILPILGDRILGLGVGRIARPNPYTDFMMAWVKKYCKGKWVHFYGIALRLIKKYVKELEDAGVKVSVDSTKWTRAVTDSLKKRHGVACRKDTRNLYFLEYMNEIRKAGIEVEY